MTRKTNYLFLPRKPIFHFPSSLFCFTFPLLSHHHHHISIVSLNLHHHQHHIFLVFSPPPPLFIVSLYHHPYSIVSPLPPDSFPVVSHFININKRSALLTFCPPRAIQTETTEDKSALPPPSPYISLKAIV